MINNKICCAMNSIEWFKALADATRARILNLLLNRELNVKEMMDILGIGQSRISRHLKILTDCGLAQYKRDGLWSFYRAVNDGYAGRFLLSVHEYISEAGKNMDDLVKADIILHERRESCKKFFDSVADDWSNIRRSIVGDKEIAEEFLEHLPSGVSADLGCGSGDLIISMFKWADSVIGVDFSREMLKKAAQKLEKYKDRLHLRIGQIEHLPLKEREVSSVVMNMVLHHLPNPSIAFEESFRVLENGGTAIVVDLCKHRIESMRHLYGDQWLGFFPASVISWAEKAGFTLKEQGERAIKDTLTAFFVILRKP